MAEFCLDCWNKMNETKDPPARYVLSRDTEICEGCGEYKQVVVAEKLWSRVQKKWINRKWVFKKTRGK